MFRRIVSLLILLACVGVLPAQVQPKPTPHKPELVPKEPTLDEKIALALRNHPDIKIAEAKRALAEAELEQAKLALSQKIAIANAKVSTTQEELSVAKEMLKKTESIAMSGLEILQVKKNATIAASNLTLAETELKNLLTMPKAEIVTLVSHSKNLEEQQNMYFKFVGKAPHSEVAKRLLELLNTTVQLDLKTPPLIIAFDMLVEKARVPEVSIRFAKYEMLSGLKVVPKLSDITGRKTLFAWLQMIMDDLNSEGIDDELLRGPYDVYVRDYGLLICPIRSAPKDAMTMSEFIRHESGKKQ